MERPGQLQALGPCSCESTSTRHFPESAVPFRRAARGGAQSLGESSWKCWRWPLKSWRDGGADAPTVKNVVLVRVVGSMSEFKQIIGRGTRVRDDYGKLFFNILDYTGSATTPFADPDFDGEPARVSEEKIDDNGKAKPETVKVVEPAPVKVSEPPDPPHGRDYYIRGAVAQPEAFG